MSDLTNLPFPHFIRWSYRIIAAIQRIAWRRRSFLYSRWFTNLSGNFAARAHAVSTEKGLKVWLTLRRGWHSGEYAYSYLSVLVPENSGQRKAYQLACQQAEHLARFRYRFQS